MAALLVFAGVIRTAWTHDGSGIAQAVTGVGKAVLAWMLTAAVATAALAASDQITRLVVDAVVRQPAGPGRPARHHRELGRGHRTTRARRILGGSLLLVFALIGIALVIVLWFELLLRNAAIAVLVATSPIAAAGQASEATKAWWARTASATAQLIILKPVIALVFAVGFGMAGTSSGIDVAAGGPARPGPGRVRLAGDRPVLHLRVRPGVQLRAGDRARVPRRARPASPAAAGSTAG